MYLAGHPLQELRGSPGNLSLQPYPSYPAIRAVLANLAHHVLQVARQDQVSQGFPVHHRDPGCHSLLVLHPFPSYRPIQKAQVFLLNQAHPFHQEFRGLHLDLQILVPLSDHLTQSDLGNHQNPEIKDSIRFPINLHGIIFHKSSFVLVIKHKNQNEEMLMKS